MKLLLTLALTSVAFAQQWTPLFDGKSMKGWTTEGNANWRVADGAVQANAGNGFLVTKDSYKDFEMRVEFWADENANSGVYARCTNLADITSTTSYEFNIYDKRPDQKYATGTIVDVATIAQPVKAANRWNTFEIRAQGDHLILIMNGAKLVDVHDSQFAQGPIALQASAGTIKFRKVEIRKL